MTTELLIRNKTQSCLPTLCPQCTRMYSQSCGYQLITWRGPLLSIPPALSKSHLLYIRLILPPPASLYSIFYASIRMTSFLKINQIISISWLKSSNHNNKIQSSYCAQGLRWCGFCFSFPLKYPLDSMGAWHILFSVPCTIPDRAVAP